MLRQKSAVTLATPLTLEAAQDGVKIKFRNMAKGFVACSINGGDDGCKKIEAGSTRTITLKRAGDKAAFYGVNYTYYGRNGKRFVNSNIACSAPCYVYGNIMSLVSCVDTFKSAKKLYASRTFYGLFKENAFIMNKKGAELFLPATTLASECYRYMFCGCTGLTRAPALPAKKLAYNCYGFMFMGSGIMTAPDLPAKKLEPFCYNHMFFCCDELQKAPALPATRLAEWCYHKMFGYCLSLKTPPALPARVLEVGCYIGMFEHCVSLKRAPKITTDVVRVPKDWNDDESSAWGPKLTERFWKHWFYVDYYCCDKLLFGTKFSSNMSRIV